jgi:hypothetical protein
LDRKQCQGLAVYPDKAPLQLTGGKEEKKKPSLGRTAVQAHLLFSSTPHLSSSGSTTNIPPPSPKSLSHLFSYLFLHNK